MHHHHLKNFCGMILWLVSWFSAIQLRQWSEGWELASYIFGTLAAIATLTNVVCGWVKRWREKKYWRSHRRGR